MFGAKQIQQMTDGKADQADNRWKQREEVLF